jgi:hypothetical protein
VPLVEDIERFPIGRLRAPNQSIDFPIAFALNRQLLFYGRPRSEYGMPARTLTFEYLIDFQLSQISFRLPSSQIFAGFSRPRSEQ